jgi:branched-chain amino acid transport system permease protein
MYLAAQVLNALVIGILYALSASGLALIFGILRVVNFAHGEFYMVGGYLYYFLTVSGGVPSVLAVAISVATLFVFGLVVERVLIRRADTPAVERRAEYVILITFALSIFLQNAFLVLFGPWNMQPPSMFTGSLQVGDLVIGGDRLAAFATGVVLVGVLIYVLQRTFVGRALRAVSQHREGAAVVGINPVRMGALAFGIGSALAGGAGALIGPIFLVNSRMGILPGVKAFVIIVLGGMGSVKGSILGALLLALVESFGSILIPDPSRALAYKDAYGLLVLVVVLLLRPEGLFGEWARRA